MENIFNFAYKQKCSMNLKLSFVLFLFFNIISNSLIGQNSEEIYANAMKKMASGEYKIAIQEFDKAIKLDKDDAFKYANRGKAYIKLEKYKKAISDFKRAIKTNSSQADFHYHMGIAQDSIKRYEDAVKAYSKAIKIDQNNANFYIGRGNVYEKNKQYNAALANYNVAIQYEPKNAFAYFKRAIVKYKVVDTFGACLDIKESLKLGYKQAERLKNKYCED